MIRRDATTVDFDSDGQGDPCDPDPPGMTCGDANVTSARIDPNILVVLDRSLSMNSNNKWNDAVTALDAMSTSLAGDLRLGLALYGADDEMCIDVQGAACEALKSGDAAQVIFGCPADGGPPIID